MHFLFYFFSLYQVSHCLYASHRVKIPPVVFASSVLLFLYFIVPLYQPACPRSFGDHTSRRAINCIASKHVRLLPSRSALDRRHWTGGRV